MLRVYREWNGFVKCGCHLHAYIFITTILFPDCHKQHSETSFETQLPTVRH